MSGAAAGHRRRDLLTDPNFLLVWGSGALSSTARWLELLVIGVFVFDLTDSPSYVALMIILRILPLALFSAFAGAFAERVNRQDIQLVGLVCMFAVSMGLGFLVVHDLIQIWHLGLSCFLSGMLWATDLPMRRTIMAELAGPRRVGPAMSLESVTSAGTRVTGPLLGGLVLQDVGLDGAFFLSALLYSAGFLAIALLVHIERPAPVGAPGILSSIAEGLRHLRHDHTLSGILVVTLIHNLWGWPSIAMIPVIGRDVLGLGPFPVGLLASAEGAGATLGAVLIFAAVPVRQFRRLYSFGTAVFLVMTLAFSVSHSAPLSGALLLVAGLGTAAFSTMQSTLVLLNSPPEVRNRMMGVLSVCIGSGLIGFIHIGLLADWLGGQWAVAIIAGEGLIALLIAMFIFPELRAPQGS